LGNRNVAAEDGRVRTKIRVDLLFPNMIREIHFAIEFIEKVYMNTEDVN
jgi:hypothetical protein